MQNEEFVSITQNKEVNQAIEDNSVALMLLNESITEMLKLSGLKDIYQYIVKFLHKLYPDAISLITSINEDAMSTVLEAEDGIGVMFNTIVSIGGINPVGRKFKLHDLHNEVYKTGKFHRFNGGLKEFSYTEYPSEACVAIEKLLGIRSIYTIGINKDDQIMGAIHLFNRSKKEITDFGFIEAFVRQAGLVIDKKKIELDLTSREQALKAHIATKDRFFKIISHDLKGPFNAILGMSDQALKCVRKQDYENLEAYIELVHKSSQRAYGLLKNLLEWSRSQLGEMEINLRNASIAEAVDETAELLQPGFDKKEVGLEISVPSGLMARADEYMLDTIIRNLLSNALKYTNRGGLVSVHAESQGKSVSIVIKDTGIGIDEKYHGHLFGMENNYNRPGTEDEQGTGLGLILCNEFAQKMNGSIAVTSKINEGSAFQVILPKA